MKETHILRKGNPSLLLGILAALGSVGAWPGSCPGCIRLVHVAGAAVLIVILVLVAAELALAKEERNAERDLIVFVGKRLSVAPQREASGTSLDLKFEARYRVLQVVFGRYDRPEIAFTVYDHYGPPEFSRYDMALMFVSRHKGKLYHEKYQFNPVYPTADGRWAGCGDPYRFDAPVHKRDLKPVAIRFATTVREETSGEPCTQGNYAEELFLVKKNGVLKARGWF
jgi:hypothetical protein